MSEVLTAIVIMTGLGLFFAVVLAVADHYLRVWEDPRIGKVTDLLPGNNCGACGQPGCAAFSERVVAGEIEPGKCTVADGGTLEEIANFLGVDVGGGEQIVARLQCGGGKGRVRNLAAYQGMDSCRAAAIVDGGGQACSWGCLGLSDCAVACTFKAIHMNERALPVVTPDLCTACGDCVEACPKGLFVLQPISQTVIVQCSAPLEGDDARAMCSAACDACGRCAADAPGDTIMMKGGLPIIDWEQEERPGQEVTWRCPTGAIQWVDGAQFREDVEDNWEDEAWRLRA